MAEEGNEGLVYGLLTTTANLGAPVARAIGNQLFGLFRPSLSDSANYIADTPAFRRTVSRARPELLAPARTLARTLSTNPGPDPDLYLDPKPEA